MRGEHEYYSLFAAAVNMQRLYLARYLCVNASTVRHHHNGSLTGYLQRDIDRLTNWQRVFTGKYSAVDGKPENAAHSQLKRILLSASTCHFG